MVVVHMDTRFDTTVMSRAYEGLDCTVFLTPTRMLPDSIGIKPDGFYNPITNDFTITGFTVDLNRKQ